MFIEYNVKGRSTREKELLDSEAKAHAARWGFQKSAQNRRNAHGSRLGVVRFERKDGQNTATSSRRGQQLSPAQQALSKSTASRDGLMIEPEQLLSPYDLWQMSQDMLAKVATPVQSYPVPLDRNKLRAIEYFPELWSRWAADVIPNRNDRQVATNRAVSSIVQRCLTDELHMMSFMSYVLQRAPATGVSKVLLLQIAGKALSELRSRIESGNASLEEVVWPIIFLAHYELFGSKSVGAGRAHLKAVVDLGGMEYLDEVTKVYIRRMDRGWWSNYPSIFPQTNSPRPRLERLLPEMSNDDSAGSGFFNHADVLGTALVEMLPFAVDCVRAGVLCSERVVLGIEDEGLQNKVIRQCQTIMDRLRERLPGEPEQMACIYPVMIWLQYTTWVMRDLATKASSRVDAYRNITTHAHPVLLKCLQQSTQAPEMLLWAAAVGVATAADKASRVKYANLARGFARALDVVDLRKSWKRYMWFEDCNIIDYTLICAALDEAVRQDTQPVNQHWRTARTILSYRLGRGV